MNFYILVEGKSTETEIYPHWIKHSLPKLSRVYDYNLVKKNHYFLFSSNGIPSIYDDILNAIKDINDSGGYDYLIIFIDAEELTVEGRKKEIFEYIAKEKISLKKCKLEIFVQNRCIESWFLGNKKIVKRNPQSRELKKLINHYNVVIDDPEKMDKYSLFKGSIARFHFHYLNEAFKERGLSYKKGKIKHVQAKTYLTELIKRISTSPNHLKSFRELTEFITKIKKID